LALMSGPTLAGTINDRQGDTPSSSRAIPYVRYASVTANGSGWWFSPLDIKFANDDDSQDWTHVPTKESYKLKPIGFYGVDAVLETPHFSVSLAYERGGGLGASLSSSSLLDFLFQLHGIPYVDRLTFGTTILDFANGEALLLNRQTDSTIDQADFQLQLRRFSLGYQMPEAKIVAEYLGYKIPRNIYLQHKQGSDGNESYTYYAISDQLMKVDSKAFFVGLGVDNREHEFKDGLLQPYDRDQSVVVGGTVLVGGGPYKITSATSDQHLDKGSLVAIGLSGSALLQRRFWKYVTVGASLDLSFYFFQPIGLSEKLKDQATANGVQIDGIWVDTDDLSINFGTVDTLARMYGFVRVDY
jgi:hypothetical protein